MRRGSRHQDNDQGVAALLAAFAKMAQDTELGQSALAALAAPGQDARAETSVTPSARPHPLPPPLADVGEPMRIRTLSETDPPTVRVCCRYRRRGR